MVEIKYKGTTNLLVGKLIPNVKPRSKMDRRAKYNYVQKWLPGMSMNVPSEYATQIFRDLYLKDLFATVKKEK